MLHEGPFQASRRACSRTLKGVFHNLEWPPLYLRTMKIAYKHTLLNPPKQPCLIHKPTPNCPHLLPVSPQTHSSSSTKSWYIISNPNLFRLPTPLRIVYKLILYHPLSHGISSTNSLCALSKPSLHCLRPNVLYSFAQGLLLHNTQKKKKQKTTVFYFFFFFNLYFSSYTPYV